MSGEVILYGPDNRPLMVSTDHDGLERVAKDGAWRQIEDEVAKRVRSQSTSLSQVWDPRRGKPKPTSITFETLRMISNRSEVARSIIKTRLNQIGKAKWSITAKDKDDGSSSTQKLCDDVTALFRRPSLRGSRPHSRSWRQFIGEVLQDILVLDAGCIEKERNSRKWIVAMYPVDGATIQPNIDDRGGYAEDAYVQIVDGTVTARFGMEDLIYIMDNPQTDVKYAGYGYSPLEWLLVSVTAELYSSKYNSSYFEKGAIPEGMINLGEEVAPEDVDAFRLYWMNEIMGKPWAIPIVGGKGVDWIQWRNSNKDMEYMEYQKWLLQKMCAVYQIPPQEVGQIEDVNRSTADEQDSQNDSKSLEPVKTLLQDYIEAEIIGEHGLGVGDLIEFQFDEEDESEDAIDQRFSIRVQSGAATRNEWREAVNMEPSDDEGADMLLVAGQLSPLPTEEDAAVMGAAAQQQHEDEQNKLQAEQGGVGPGSMPWKPANPDDQDFQNAKADHDLNSGMGPKQDNGPPQFGKTYNPGLNHMAALHEGRAVFHPKVKAHLDQFSGYHEAHAKLRGAQAKLNADPGNPKLLSTFQRAHSAATAASNHVADVHRDAGVTWKAGGTVSKTAPFGQDRNPALTRVHDGLEDVFNVTHLFDELEDLLGVPLDPEAAELTD